MLPVYSSRRGVGRSVASVCLSVCPRSERITSCAISTKFGRHIVYGRTLACTDPEVKRSNANPNRPAWVCVSRRLVAAGLMLNRC